MTHFSAQRAICDRAVRYAINGLRRGFGFDAIEQPKKASNQMSNDQYCVIEIHWQFGSNDTTTMRSIFWRDQRFASIDAAHDAIACVDPMGNDIHNFDSEYNVFIHGFSDVDPSQWPTLWPLRAGEARFVSEGDDDEFTEYRVMPVSHLCIEPRWVVTYCRVKHMASNLAVSDYIDQSIRDCAVMQNRKLEIEHSNDGKRIDVWDVGKRGSRRRFATLVLSEIAV